MCWRSCMAWSDKAGRLYSEYSTVPVERAVMETIDHFELKIVVDRQQDEICFQEGHAPQVSALHILHD